MTHPALDRTCRMLALLARLDMAASILIATALVAWLSWHGTM
jgi:hypothetical protein